MLKSGGGGGHAMRDVKSEQMSLLAGQLTLKGAIGGQLVVPGFQRGLKEAI